MGIVGIEYKMSMGIRFMNLINFPASDLPNWYFLTIYIVGVSLALAWEGYFLELEFENDLQPVSQ